MKPIKFYLTAALTAILATTAFSQTTRYVDGINGNDQDGENDCTNENLPCQTISHAIDVSFGGDVIDIADAVYTETPDIPRSLTLHGESEEDTIIQAHAQPGDATSRVITIDGDFEVEITDLTIRHGNATGSTPNNRGGGIYNNGATLSLINVTFSQNSADAGGGLFNDSGSVSLVNVRFTMNSAEDDAGGFRNKDGDATLTNVHFTRNTAEDGGGMYNRGSFAILMTNVHFTSNSAGSLGGGMYNRGTNAKLTGVRFIRNTAEFGGGMFNTNFGDAKLTNVTFDDNTASSQGGGMFNIHDSSPTLENVLFEANHAAGTEEYRGGGGMFTTGDSGSSPTLMNVRFINNTAAEHGGGMRISGGELTLRNVRFSGNEAQTSGGGVYVDENPFVSENANFLNAIFYNNHAHDGHGGAIFTESDTDVALINVAVSGNSAAGHGGGVFNGSDETNLFNAIVWGNTAGGADDIFTSTDANTQVQFSLYSDEAGDIGGSGEFQVDENSLTMDPLFLEPENGNLRLTEGSPAIDAGFESTPPAWFPTDDNGDPIDLLGNPRFFGEAIDMGAYEWDPSLSVITHWENGIAGLTLYPNPVRDILHLSTDEPISRVAVYNLLGQVTLSQHIGSAEGQLDLSGLSSGVYVLKVQAGGQEGVYRIIKK